MTCGDPAHVVRMPCTDGAKHWHVVNIGAWPVLSIFVSNNKGADKRWSDEVSILHIKTYRETFNYIFILRK